MRPSPRSMLWLWPCLVASLQFVAVDCKQTQERDAVGRLTAGTNGSLIVVREFPDVVERAHDSVARRSTRESLFQLEARGAHSRRKSKRRRRAQTDQSRRARGAPSSARFKLVKTDPHTVNARGAACLDGSPPAYYIRTYPKNARPSSKTSWVFFFEGGGWCDSVESCLGRSTGRQGTSLRLSAEYPGYTEHSVFSTNSVNNPDFWDWNFAYLPYCDGGSFSGTRKDPIEATSASGESSSTGSSSKTLLYLRGRRNLEAILDDLTDGSHPYMSSATRVLVMGCSMGGAAVYMNCDYIAARLSQAKVMCAPDGGFFINAPAIDGKRRWAVETSLVWSLHEMGRTGSWDCIKEHSATLATWKCLLPQYNARYIQTPLFVIQSIFDPFQFMQILAPPSADPTGSYQKCLQSSRMSGCNSSQLQKLTSYAMGLQGIIEAAVLFGRPQNGAFLTDVQVHCQTVKSRKGWRRIYSRGRQLSKSVAEWVAKLTQ